MIYLDPNTQNLSCSHCGEVTRADGSKVWVCKSCGRENTIPDLTPDPSAAQAEILKAADQLVQPGEPTGAPAPLIVPETPAGNSVPPTAVQ